MTFNCNKLITSTVLMLRVQISKQGSWSIQLAQLRDSHPESRLIPVVVPSQLICARPTARWNIKHRFHPTHLKHELAAMKSVRPSPLSCPVIFHNIHRAIFATFVFNTLSHVTSFNTPPLPLSSSQPSCINMQITHSLAQLTLIPPLIKTSTRRLLKLNYGSHEVLLSPLVFSHDNRPFPYCYSRKRNSPETLHR